jgi:hypothetical protein
MDEYHPGGEVMTDEESQAWPLMNILMGRVYSRLADLPDQAREDGHDPPKSKGEYLRMAEECFLRIDKRYKDTYQSAAHNGLGAIYNRVLTPTLRDGNELAEEASVCGKGAGPEDCANKALAEYLKVTEYLQGDGNSCSYEVRRAENNKVLLLAMIGLDIDKLHLDKINLNKVCDPNEKGRVGLANCIEKRIDGLMKCVAYEPFRPVWFTTTAQGYGASAELRRGELPAEAAVRAAEAAGRYLRLSYALRQTAQENPGEMKNSWGLCYFRFANKDADLSAVFWYAMGLGPAPASRVIGVTPLLKTLEPLPAPNPEGLRQMIKEGSDCRAQ